MHILVDSGVRNLANTDFNNSPTRVIESVRRAQMIAPPFGAVLACAFVPQFGTGVDDAVRVRKRSRLPFGIAREEPLSLDQRNGATPGRVVGSGDSHTHDRRNAEAQEGF